MALAFFLTLPGLDRRRPAAAVGLDEVQALFQPGKRHAIEQRRLEHVLAGLPKSSSPSLLQAKTSRYRSMRRAMALPAVWPGSA